MRLKLKTVPTVEPVTLAEAKLHMRIDSSDENALITSLITTARQLAERETKRAFITQTWEMFLDIAPQIINVPKPPLQSIVSIKVLDNDGASTTIDAGDYMVDASQNSLGRVTPKIGYAWPYHRGFASFIVEYKAGYGDAAANVPEKLKQGILRFTAHLYENRESSDIPGEVKFLLWPFMIRRL